MLSCGACVCVSDRTNDAVFVAFDMEMDKLTNLQTEVAHILVWLLLNHFELNKTLPYVFSFLNKRFLGFAGSRCRCSCGHELPPFVANIVGKLHFPAQAKRVQFYFHTPNFTISCIITELQRAPLLAFVVDVGTLYRAPIYIFINNIIMLVIGL